MATGATGQLGLALPVQGELSGTWGDTVNNGITQYTNIAIAGTLTLTGDGAVTLANTTGDASASNITSTLAGAGTVTAQFSTIRVSGTTVTKVVTGPSYSKSYLIDNASSYTVTFKASGQTGVSISPNEKVYVYYNATDYVKVGGGGITYGAVKTTTYTAVANDGVLTNTTSAAFTVNLPATPATGTQVFIADSAGTWATNNLTIGRNGSTIAGSATDLVCDINSVSIQCIYDGTTWDIFAQIGANDTAVVTLNGTQTLTNKTLTSPTITGTGAIAAATVTLSSTLSVTGVSTLTGGAVIQGLTVGRGAGAVATNTAVGSGALQANTTGSISVALGYQAGYAKTTAGGNVAIGHQAQYAGTTGDDNVSVGTYALYNNTGANNVAIGSVALGNAANTGSGLVAVGRDALRNNTTGSNNTALGYQAGYTQTTSTSGTVIGYQAGYASTGNTLNESVFVGHQTGYYQTGGSNTAIGHSAFLGSTTPANNTGYYNTSVGIQALKSNTSGANTTAIGYQALQGNTSASNNVGVGYQAGYSANTGANNAFLGYQAGYGTTSGYQCTALGAFALKANVTNLNCVAVGHESLLASTANSNTAIGQSSGSAITTGYNHTIIGRYTGNQGGLDIRTANNYIVLSDGDGNPRGFFDASGNFLIGVTSTIDGAKMTVKGSATVLSVQSASNGNYVLASVNASGSVVGGVVANASSTQYNTSSDYRLKNTIAPMTGALAKVALLKPVTYKWNIDGSNSQGFIAHELAEVVPECVTGEKDAVDADGNPKYQGIDTSFLVATLTAAIQELKSEFDAYKASHP